MTKQKAIYWHRITVYTMSGHEETFMYPSNYKIWDDIDLLNALYDLDYDGYPATQSYAGWSLIDDDKNAGWVYYKMEA